MKDDRKSSRKKSESFFKSRMVKWAESFLLFVVLGPFAIVLVAAVFGGPMPGGWFGIWFMGVLTFGGVVTTLDLLKSARMHGIGELGCAIPTAGITCWFGWILLRELGLLE